MYKPFVCRVAFPDDMTSVRYGVSAGNELEAREAISRKLSDEGVKGFEILELREATKSEAASLRLSAGMVKIFP